MIIANKISKQIQLADHDVEILHETTIHAKTGEFLSVIGPSGSGKTTLLNCLSGLVKPTSGEFYIDGQCIQSLSAQKLAQLRRTTISTIFQSYNLLPALNVLDNVILPLRLNHQRISKVNVETLLGDLNFKASLSQFPSQLSGGEQQKVAIARTLVMHAKIIFADEPTGALDSMSREVIFQQLRELANNGVCIIMVTHDIEQAARTDRALILSDGHIVSEVERPSVDQLFTQMDSIRG
ncbi:ABC transporter ATP-binding protein [Lactiplantibacillus plantarum]|uniref:ABC transporter ATP-binding protein n=1 Tax=Lactiplantibacillus plantarum TaxID=1590 RepID=UPI00193A7D48|nr:ABC transporter ATP-binding protein [Lactiplantibacillus plantarum]MCT3231019.1 ABC transporter ATP-binding protein [Lactiplantibacillus plantarum]MCT3548571.1 ABC transporter ATP-binding protein [Lactiplantibacillus plantarum]QRG94304.1 ABC transporter ATP-binding protein [Lactiplantibacillus plantarum]